MSPDVDVRADKMLEVRSIERDTGATYTLLEIVLPYHLGNKTEITAD